MGRQRSVESYELGRKVGKITDSKTHNDNNRAKLKDAKCTILCACLIQSGIAEQGRSWRFAGITSLKCSRIARVE